jgi:hypothetical protein
MNTPRLYPFRDILTTEQPRRPEIADGTLDTFAAIRYNSLVPRQPLRDDSACPERERVPIRRPAHAGREKAFAILAGSFWMEMSEI